MIIEYPEILYKCDRCDHEWRARKNTEPKMCPECKSLLWNKGAKQTIKPVGIK